MRRAWLMSVVGILLVVTRVGAAQEPPRDLSSIRVAVGTMVYVSTRGGAELRGQFARVSDQSLVIIGPEGRELSVPAGEVARVWRRGDRLRNGAIIGGLVGVLGGVFGQSACTDCSGEIALAVGVGVPMWAGVGALIDRAHTGRTLIYRAP